MRIPVTILGLSAGLVERIRKSSTGPKRNAEAAKLAECKFHLDSRRSLRTRRSS